MLKPDGQIFIFTFADHFVDHAFQKQFQEGKWGKSTNPAQYIDHLLKDLGFTLDGCNHEIKMFHEERLNR